MNLIEALYLEIVCIKTASDRHHHDSLLLSSQFYGKRKRRCYSMSHYTNSYVYSPPIAQESDFHHEQQTSVLPFLLNSNTFPLSSLSKIQQAPRPHRNNTNEDWVRAILLDNKRLSHQSLRVARFHRLLSSIHHGGAISPSVLFILLATVGQLALQSTRTMPSAASGAEFSPSDPEPMLKCVLCNAHIPLSDLSRHEPRTRSSYTAELLAGLLVTWHLEHCTGRRGSEMLRADDAPTSVAECGRFRKATELLSGMLSFSKIRHSPNAPYV